MWTSTNVKSLTTRFFWPLLNDKLYGLCYMLGISFKMSALMHFKSAPCIE